MALVCGTALVAAALLLFELRGRGGRRRVLATTGLLGITLVVAAILRPVSVTSRGTLAGPRVLVLVDQSRRLDLPASTGGTRRAAAERAVAEVRRRLRGARLEVFGFGDGPPLPWSEGEQEARAQGESDLEEAISTLSRQAAERPGALVVVSDGRLSRPSDRVQREALRKAVDGFGVPVHTVAIEQREPRDASIRALHTAAAAVAHQPLTVHLEIGCGGGLECHDIPVRIRELRAGGVPALLASGRAEVPTGSSSLELRITLERAGARVVEVSIVPPPGDEVPQNDTRLMTFEVTRDRVRLLHVAGRPTYDVRALRVWLKSDEAVDLVAFFILRTQGDDPGHADESELALIPFPVDELFTQHLTSFDAVMLQDIDANEYEIQQHLPALARYVESGGGLIMVGGPSSFVGGGYASSGFDHVLPVELDPTAKPYDTLEFTPAYTTAGAVAPILRALRDLHGEQLPSLPGANILGRARSGAIVLLEHPQLRAGQDPMPVLALGESGDGRAIALGTDGTHRLAFGRLAAAGGGRGFGAMWDGLLGWLMRDPRYEVGRLELEEPCIAGRESRLRFTRLGGIRGDLEVELTQLGVEYPKPARIQVPPSPSEPVVIPLGRLRQGGYTVRARVGKAPPARQDFACEEGGEAFGDARPDPDRLRRIAAATGGTAVTHEGIHRLPSPKVTEITSERQVKPLAPPWAWSLAAAAMLAWHWFLRRRQGLA